jgi:hypothetical protein
MFQEKELEPGIYVSQKSICRDLGLSRSTIFRVIQKYKSTYKTEIIPGKYETILGSCVFEKNIFITWFKSIYIVQVIRKPPVDLFSKQKLNHF